MSRHLLDRLDEIGASLASEPGGLALLGLGSVGVELERLDDHSDLDFFAVVESGTKGRFLDSLDWLARIHPIEYAHRNTIDGFKVMYADGIFCEFAVFEPAELATAVYPPTRVVWAHERFDDSSARSGTVAPRPHQSAQFLVDEALTNLYVGLLRDHRGERLAACRMIQVFALDRLMELVALTDEAASSHRDPFGDERRFEIRFPELSADIARCSQGYEHNRASAAAILELLEARGHVDRSMRHRVVELF